VVLRTSLLFVVLVGAALCAPSAAAPAPNVLYGIQDDAWLLGGPGTYTSRLRFLKGLGPDVVRVNVRWNEIARRKPARPTKHTDRAYRWDPADALLNALQDQGTSAVVTLTGTPRWANGGRGANWAPKNPAWFGSFAYAAARRYPQVRHWVIWNEPNKNWSLRPTTASTYVRLLNAAYAAIKRVNPRDLVAGGVTAPRGGTGDVEPIDWIRGMRAANARLDAYAHHPYPLDPNETPFAGACRACSSLTLASLDRLLVELSRAFGAKPVWLTEYGYQTNPPDRLLGVSETLQARYLAEAALKSYLTPRVKMLIHFLIRDERSISRWQSGLFTFNNRAKRGVAAFRLPLAQLKRRGPKVTLWGQVRPGTGRQSYRVRFAAGNGWRWLPGRRVTDGRGHFTITLRLPRGARAQLWSRGTLGAPLRIR
jgi:Cellulase (glycosyl hydrolase family 5)